MAPPRRRTKRTTSKGATPLSDPSRLKIDAALLAELGLASLPPDEAKLMLAQIYETLELRVGMKLADQLTDDQIDAFERFFTANDEAGARQWLNENFPTYRELVSAEFEELKIEIRGLASDLLAVSMERRARLNPMTGAASAKPGKHGPTQRQRAAGEPTAPRPRSAPTA